MPIHFDTTISIPGLAPPVFIIASFFTFPTPDTEITGRFTAADTSVCPPRICMWNFSHVASASRMISFKRASSLSSGKRIVSITPTGSAPLLARSFAVVMTARLPISFPVPVIGSVDITNTSSASSVSAAQSSPTPAPRSTSSRLLCSCLNTERFNTLSGIFPVFMFSLLSLF